jgi:hypothetical protein
VDLAAAETPAVERACPGQALANKIKLSPEQIKKACKIGECSPK